MGARNTLAAAILGQLLGCKRSLNKYEIQKLLGSQGFTATTREINSVLYSFDDLFECTDAALPGWRAAVGSRCRLGKASSQSTCAADFGRWYVGPAPRDWQLEAVESWCGSGRRGVVEAVTGTGKTTLGLLAAADAKTRGIKTLILVPSRDLLRQWFGVLSKGLKGVRVGRAGDGHDAQLADHDILVATVQTASKYRMLPDGAQGLLIADEVHRYGTEDYARALEEEFVSRLGLTATYERQDNGVARFLAPYFLPAGEVAAPAAEVVARCGYARGLADGILAPFRVGLVPVTLDAEETSAYEEFDSRARKARAELIKTHRVPSEPFGEYMRTVARLSDGDNGNPVGTALARAYLGAFSKRRSLLADSSRKLEALSLLSTAVAESSRCIVFTETVDSAVAAAARLHSVGIAAADYSSELTPTELETRLADFKSGAIRVLAAPKVLDEGVDIPEADLGVILAASKNKRQMIQRMGRLIRPKRDGRPASFVIVYAAGTSEDPESGAHEAFLQEMLDNADAITQFEPGVAPQVVSAWYRDGRTSVETVSG